MTYNLENTKKFTNGVLSQLSGDGFVAVDSMELDLISARKLARTVISGRVTRENQDLFIPTITIKKFGLNLFTKGQGGMIRDGNQYVMTTNSRNPIRFKADLKGLVEGSDGYTYECLVKIGNIAFDLQNTTPELNDDIATFRNVKATLYPFGTYQANIVKDE